MSSYVSHSHVLRVSTLIDAQPSVVIIGCSSDTNGRLPLIPNTLRGPTTGVSICITLLPCRLPHSLHSPPSTSSPISISSIAFLL